MTRSDILECFILRFADAIPDPHDLGRPVAITQLWIAAGEQCGDCDMDHVLDALYNLDPGYADVYKFEWIPSANGFQRVTFRRSAPDWKAFFLRGDFRIKLLPAGRRRMDALLEILEREILSQPEPNKPRPEIGFLARSVAS